MPQTVLITGAAQGLGRSIAERFVAAGNTVIGLDLKVPNDVPFEVLAVDITDRDAIDQAFNTVMEKHGQLDVCVNAAGIYPRSKLADFSVDTYRLIFDVNVLGTWLVAAAFAQRAKSGSVILNIASVDGVDPEPVSLFYSASKAAVINLTKGMANELESQGIRVLGVAPASIATQQLISASGFSPDLALPETVAETIWRLSNDGGVPLVSGETITVKARPGLDNPASTQ